MQVHYADSPILGLPIKIETENQQVIRVTVKDLQTFPKRKYVEYNSREIQLLKQTGITPAVHLIKKCLNAEIVGVK